MRSPLKLLALAALGLTMAAGSAEAAFTMRDLRLDRVPLPAASLIKVEFQPAPEALVRIWQTYGGQCRDGAAN